MTREQFEIEEKNKRDRIAKTVMNQIDFTYFSTQNTAPTSGERWYFFYDKKGNYITHKALYSTVRLSFIEQGKIEVTRIDKTSSKNYQYAILGLMKDYELKNKIIAETEEHRLYVPIKKL